MVSVCRVSKLKTVHTVDQVGRESQISRLVCSEGLKDSSIDLLPRVLGSNVSLSDSDVGVHLLECIESSISESMVKKRFLAL